MTGAEMVSIVVAAGAAAVAGLGGFTKYLLDRNNQALQLLEPYRRENKRMQEEINDLKAANERLVEQNAELREQVRILRERIEALEKQIEAGKHDSRH